MNLCNHAAVFSQTPDGRCTICGFRKNKKKRRDFAAGFRLAREMISIGGDKPNFAKAITRGERGPTPKPYRPTTVSRLPLKTPEEPIDLGELARIVDAEACKRSLAEFSRQAWLQTDPTTPLEWNWHHDAICDHLQRMFFEWLECLRGKRESLTIQNLLINIPPRTAKSRFVSVFFPVWAWLHQPAWRVLGVSVNPQVANRDATVSRHLLMSEWFRSTFQPSWLLDPGINARHWYANTAGGERRSFGMQANVIGLGFDAMIVDDPNDPQEVHSEAHRRKVNIDQWDMTIGNRLNNQTYGLRIGVQQRLHDDDWSGHILRQGGWEHLRSPLFYETKHDCACETCKRGETKFGFRDKRAEGENLHPPRFPDSVVDFERRRLGSYGFAGQMQQRPAPAEGAIFLKRWFKSCDEPPEKFEDLLITADLANKQTTVGSFNCLMVVGKKGAGRFVVDVRRGRGEQWTARYIAGLIEEIQATWSKRSGRAVKVLVEDKAMGPTVVQMMKQDLKVSGVVEDEEAQKARDDKVSRAIAVQPYVEAGDVSIVKAPWTDELLHELTTFPASANDDQVDCFTMALNYWRLPSAAARLAAASR